MTNFEKIKNMSLDEFAEWVDEHGMFDNTPWMKWFNENYCDKCESIFVKAEEAEKVLGIKPFYNEEYECAYCEVYENCCKFFPDKCPSNKDIIKMWLEVKDETN